MNKRIKFAVCLALLWIGELAAAYETSTHQMLTRNAIRRSVLGIGGTCAAAFPSPATLLTDLGLPEWGSASYTSSDPQNTQTMSAFDLIVFGARWEDDDYAYRVFNHFFDPQYERPTGRGLSLVVTGNPSPDWALEDRGEVVDHYDGHCAGGANCAQQFSFRKAQQAMYDALTNTTPASRLAAASRALQSLGHVIHHVQDMAQPQHTRNDQHVHPIPNTQSNPPWSYYEVRTETQNASIDTMLQVQCASNTGYPIPKFSTARQYWHTAGSTAPQYVGMAEFTSNNFTSHGTPFVGRWNAPDFIGPAPGFPLPDGSGKRIVRYSTPAVRNVSGQIIAPGEADYLVGQVYDGYTGTSTDTILATTSLTSVFTGIGQQNAALRTFVENTLIYDARYALLMPRAVAFSAGLINHFFRGRLNLAKGASNTQWTLTNIGADAMDGTFAIFAEDYSGVRRPVDGAVLRASAASGQSLTLDFTPPQHTTRLVAVFTGQIGSEGDSSLSSLFYAVAGKVVDYTPPAPPGITMLRDPSPMVAGQPYTLSWTTNNADSATYSCTPAGAGGMAASGALAVGSSSMGGVASAAWTASPSNCMYTATGPGGTTTMWEYNVTTVPARVTLPCGTPLSSTGSRLGLDVLQELGGTPGKVTVQFNAYSIADGLDITADNNSETSLVATRGLVSGTHTYSFNHDPAARGSTKVRVSVTGNDDPGTVWDVAMSCPGGQPPATPKVNVRFGKTGGDPTCPASWALQVDGKAVLFPGSLAMSPSESHSYLLKLSIPPTWNCHPGYPYYEDNVGRHPMYTGTAIGMFVQ